MIWTLTAFSAVLVNSATGFELLIPRKIVSPAEYVLMNVPFTSWLPVSSGCMEAAAAEAGVPWFVSYIPIEASGPAADVAIIP